MPYNFQKTFDEYYNLFEEELNKYLIQLSEQISPSLKDAICYSVLGGGKRLRPILGMATADLLGINFNKIKYLLIALELIQSYSLVHDDLPAMDNDDYRRGKLSTHKKFGEAMGILSGDAMLNLAMEVSLKATDIDNNYLNAMRLIFDYSGYNGMVYGQVLDLENENNPKLDKGLLFEIYQNKTAKMFKVPLLAMSLCADEKYFNELNEYGNSLGFAFQIRDDILDVEGSLESLGKTPNKDENSNKLTSVRIYGLEGAKKKFNELFNLAIQSIQGIENNQFLIDFAYKLYNRKH